jgi:hypothetical protein
MTVDVVVAMAMTSDDQGGDRAEAAPGTRPGRL